MSYKHLSDKDIIDSAIDFIKHNQKIPVELKERLKTIGMLDMLDPFGDDDD